MPTITKSRAERWRDRVTSFVRESGDAARRSPHMVVTLVKTAAAAAPSVAARVKEDVVLYRENRRAKGKAEAPMMDAAAE